MLGVHGWLAGDNIELGPRFACEWDHTWSARASDDGFQSSVDRSESLGGNFVLPWGSTGPRCCTVRQFNLARNATALLHQHAGVPGVTQSIFIGLSIDCGGFVWGHWISPSTKLWPDLEKRQHVTAETQHHNREPNNSRGDGQRFNADFFPHPKILAPTLRRRGLYIGIFRYRSSI